MIEKTAILIWIPVLETRLGIIHAIPFHFRLTRACYFANHVLVLQDKRNRGKMLLQNNRYLSHADRTRLQSLGTLVSVLASTKQTDGAMNIFDVICPIGFRTPLHIHYAEDVAIHVLGGSLTIFWQGEKEENVGVGSYLFQPRGTAHGFRVRGNTPARILYITTPAGFDQFVIECALANSSSAAIAAARYQLEILSPPSTAFSDFRIENDELFLSRIFSTPERNDGAIK